MTPQQEEKLKEYADWPRASSPLLDAISAVLIELAECRKDTARLTWLIETSNHAEITWLSDDFWDSLDSDNDEDVQVIARDTIDRAIESKAPMDRAVEHPVLEKAEARPTK